MKKKFINGFLMVAMVFATTSSFVSCKDNVDDDLSDVYAKMGKDYDDLSKQSEDLQKKINDLQDQINAIDPKIEQYITYEGDKITQIFQANIDSICNDYNTKIDEINNQMTVINQQITNQTLAIDEINNALSKLDVHINNVCDSVNILWARVDSIVGILKSLVGGDLVTSVYIDATRNDVLGIVKTPAFDIKAVAAYYGTNDSGIDRFPYAGYDFNVGGNRLAEYLESYELPYEGFVSLGDKDYITDSYGNAGQIYFTVNSTNYEGFDITNFAKIQIENSVGEVAPIELNVRKSSARVNWNLGRAFLEETGKDAANGFYVADATIKESDLDPSKFQIEKFINFQKLKNILKTKMDDIRNAEGETKDKAYTAYFKNFVREAAGLVLDLFQNDLNKNDLASNVSYSPQKLAFFVAKDGKLTRVAQTELDLFTTAVKPLSYNTFWEYENNKKDNWILENVLERCISRIAKEINERWGDMGVKARIVRLDETKKSVIVVVQREEVEIIIKNDDYFNDLKKALAVNGGMDAVNDKLAKLLKTYTLGKVVGRAENRINDYIDKASDYLTNLINKHLFTRAVAPIIIFETSNGLDRLCEGMFINRGVMHAYLTSGTKEYLVPAYRKYVALEKNGMLLQSEVLPGNTLVYDFDLSEKGDYKIIISCVDYFGYVITKKYDVYVK